MAVLLLLLAGAVGTILVWIGSSILERATAELARLYALPQAVEGAVLIAVGSSFPELSSTILSSLFHDAFELGVGVIVGSAIFNVLVIPALAALTAGDLRTNRRLVFTEGGFYVLAILASMAVFAAAVFLSPVEGPALDGWMTRPLALVPLVLYGGYLLLQHREARRYAQTNPPEPESSAAVWGRLVVSLALILVGVEALVWVALELGTLLGTSSFVWGLTVVAVATSLPDSVASVQAARDDRSVASLANALGSNTFDLLVAIPAGVLIAGAAIVDLGTAGPMMVILLAASLLLVVFLRTGFELSGPEAGALLAAYGGFLVVVLAQALSFPIWF